MLSMRRRNQQAGTARFANAAVRIVLSGQLMVAPVISAIAGDALPSGGTVVSGSATVGASVNGAMTIHQNTQRAIINWNSFSVGQPNSVIFNQPNSSAAVLNRVTGDTSTTIAGQVIGNGQIYLVNPNGIAITPSGTMKVDGGIVASTLNISDEDFNAGRLRFNGNGKAGGVENQGAISVGAQGFAALLGANVSNEGSISVPLGKVGLGSAEQATLDLYGDGFLQVAIPSATASAGKALVDSTGRISADGGRVRLKAATVRQAIRDAVNVSGTISARSMSGRNGAISLSGGEGGRVRVSGDLSAKGQRSKGKDATKGGVISISGSATDISGKLDVSGQSGGRIDVTGETVTVTDARLIASGAAEGGLVRVGGAFRGGASVTPSSPDYLPFIGRFGEVPALQSANASSIDGSTVIDVSSEAGVGGTVVVWSDQTTQMHGSVVAVGAERGGAVEVSSQHDLASINMASLQISSGGKLLLDPEKIEVTSGAPSNLYSSPGSYLVNDAASATVYLHPLQIAQLLLMNGVDVTLQASNDIIWDGDISTAIGTSNTYGSLTLQAGGSLTVLGNLSLRHDYTVGTTDGNFVFSANDQLMTGNRATGPATLDILSASLDAGRGSIIATMGADSGLYEAGRIRLGDITSANSLTVSNYGTTSNTGIEIHRDITTPGSQTYVGGLLIYPYGVNGLKLESTGANVTWLDEQTNWIRAGSGEPADIQFVEQGIVTRYGTLARFVEGLPLNDATRLALDAPAVGIARTYGDAPAPFTAELKIVNGSLFSGDTLSSLVGASTMSVAGLHDRTAAGTATMNAALTDPASFAVTTVNQGYFVDLRPVATQVITAPKVVDYSSFTGIQYVYGQPFPVAFLQGVLAGDSVIPTASINGAISQTTLVFDPMTEGYTLPLNTPVGGHNSTVGSLVGTSAGNYVLGSPTVSAHASVLITPAPLTISANNTAKTYGQSLSFAGTEFSVIGLVAGDGVTTTTLTSTGAAATSSAGTHSISISDAQGTGLSNYDITYSPGTLNVDRAPLTVTALDASKIYGQSGTFAGNEFSASGLVNGDTVTSVDLSSAASSATGSAGAHAISISNATGAAMSNYEITYVPGTFSVAKASLTITAADARKTYGDNITFNGTAFSVSGLLNSDAVTNVSLMSGGTSATSGAGAYAITASGATGAGLANYAISYVPGTLVVDPKIITAIAPNGSSTYGITPSFGPATLTGILPSDAALVSGVVAFTNASNSVVTLSTASSAGTYQSNVIGLSGSAAANYVLDGAASTPGVFNINRRTLSIVLANAVATYGNTVKVSDGIVTSIAGLANGETAFVNVAATAQGGAPVSLNQPVAGTWQIAAGQSAGTYTIATSGLTGGNGFDAANYSITSNTATVTINPRTLTYTAANQSQVYGSVNPGISLSGVFGSDQVSAIAVLTNAKGARSADPRTPVGLYTVSASGLTGASAPNYVLASTGHTTGTLAVTPRTVQWVPVASTSVYGTMPVVPAFALGGLLAGDQVTVTGGFLNETPSATMNAGAYATIATGLTGLDAGNYVLGGSVGGGAGVHTITRRPVTVSFDSQTMTFGDNPALAWQITSGSVLPADTLTMTVGAYSGSTRVAPVTADVGSYTLQAATPNTLVPLSANYAFTFVPGTLTIVPRQLTYAQLSNAATFATYGDDLSPYGAFTITEANGVPYTAPLTTTRQWRDALGATVSPANRLDAGTYSIDLLSNSPNFVLTGTPLAFMVNPKVITFQATDINYGTRPTGTFAGVLAGDTVSADVSRIELQQAGAIRSYDVNTIWNQNGTLLTTSPQNLPYVTSGKAYQVSEATLSGADAQNYTFGTSFAGSFDVMPRPITLTFNAPLTTTYATENYNALSGRLDYTIAGLIDSGSAAQLMPQMSLTARNTATGANAGFNGGTTAPQSGIGFIAAGTYTWSMSGWNALALSPEHAARNYVLTNVPSTSLTVAPKTLTYTMAPSSTTYGTAANLSVALNGIAEFDQQNLQGVIGFSNSNGALLALSSVPFDRQISTSGLGNSVAEYAGRLPLAPAGQYVSSLSGLTGQAASNYVFAASGNTNSTLTVDPKTITYWTGDGTFYSGIGEVGGSTADFGRYRLDGIVGSDVVGLTLAVGERNRTASDTAQTLQPIQNFNRSGPEGTYAVIGTGLFGSAARNYRLATTGNSPGTATIENLEGLRLGFLNLDVSQYVNDVDRYVDLTADLARLGHSNTGLETPRINVPGIGTSQVVTLPEGTESSGNNELVTSEAAGGGDVEMDLSGNAFVTTAAGGSTSIAGVNGNASAGAVASLTGCVGPMCTTLGAEAGAEVNANINFWSTTPIDLSSSVVATVRVESTVDLECSGQPCSLTVGHSLSAGASAGAKLDLLAGLEVTAEAGVTETTNIDFSSGCGSATCDAGVELTARVGADATSTITYDNGLKHENEVKAGADISVRISTTVGGSAGSVGAAAGVSTGEFAVGESFGAAFEDGQVKLNIGATLGVGIVGATFDLEIAVDPVEVAERYASFVNDADRAFMGFDVSQVVFADPDAARARAQLQSDFSNRVRQMQQSQLATLNRVVLQNDGSGTIGETVRRLQASEAALIASAKAAGFEIKMTNSGIQVLDTKPPETRVLTQHVDGVFEIAAGAF